MKIKTVLIDHENEYHASLMDSLSTDDHFICCGQFDTSTDAIKKIADLKPHVTVLNHHVNEMSGVELMKRLAMLCPQTQFMICTDNEDSDMILSFLQAGAKGYVLKRNGHKRVMEAITALHNGQASISTEVLSKLLENIRHKSELKENLTQRERQIMTLLAKGSSYNEISQNLFISMDTVRTHTQHIYKKLGVRSRTQAVLKISPSVLSAI